MSNSDPRGVHGARPTHGADPREPAQIHPLARRSELTDTVYAEAATIVFAATKSLRAFAGSDEQVSRRAFACTIAFALEFRRIWSPSDWATRFGVASSTIMKWRALATAEPMEACELDGRQVLEAAPREAMRKAVWDDTLAWLREQFYIADGVSLAPARTPEVIVNEARALLITKLVARLTLSTATTDREFSHNLRMCMEGARLSADQIADAIGVAVSTISRWSNGDHLPRHVMRRAVVGILRTMLEGQDRNEVVSLRL